jgi:hypothetical protein
MRIGEMHSLLDYGCGEETLWENVRGHVPEDTDYVGYDPAMPGKDEIPTGKFDCVTCTDVLEHVEPQFVQGVIAHVMSLARFVVFFNIAICPANKSLPDGRNTHLIVKSDNWWINQISAQATGWKLTRVESKRWKDVNIWATARERTDIRY